jgi:hypothetical protein
MQELLFTTDLATSFTENYEDDLLEWINYLDGSFDQILAISRKGPRIIDLLNELNIINSSLKNRTISEYAIPFLKDGKLRICGEKGLRFF